MKITVVKSSSISKRLHLEMSRGSSNVSGGTWGSSSSLPVRRSVVGVPKWCWCGERVSALISKSDHNPYMRYFRCAYAVSEKVWGDDHLFKWVEERLAEEIEMLKVKNRELEQEVKVLRTEHLEAQKRLENEIKAKVERMVSEVKCSVKKTMVQVVIGCVGFRV